MVQNLNIPHEDADSLRRAQEALAGLQSILCSLAAEAEDGDLGGRADEPDLQQHGDRAVSKERGKKKQREQDGNGMSMDLVAEGSTANETRTRKKIKNRKSKIKQKNDT
jgi:hypothetical protein